MAFANDSATPWKANFRDLNAAITRMSTLCISGRITTEMVDEEIQRLRKSWRELPGRNSDESVLQTVLDQDAIDQLDRFDRVQLAEVLRVCRTAKSLSAAGRELFSVSRMAKQSPNDADRLRKYLSRFGIQWNEIDGV
jgi:transcriptional regulatory protein RtcR